MESLKNYIPEYPSSLGVTKRFLVVSGVSLCAITGVYVLLLSQFVSGKIQERQTDEEINVNAATKVIENLQSEPIYTKSVITKQSKPIANANLKSTFVKNISNRVDADDDLLSSASKSKISVFDFESAHEKNVNANMNSNTKTVPAEEKMHKKSYRLFESTLIPVTLVTAINSELPGLVVAKVRRDVFDSESGEHCLIPQGTTIIGKYDPNVTIGQQRVALTWNRIILPSGKIKSLPDFPAIDSEGHAGLQDLVDNHYVHRFGDLLMANLLSAVNEFVPAQREQGYLSTHQRWIESMEQKLNSGSGQLVGENQGVKPTLMIRSGSSFSILLTEDVILKPSC